MSKATLSEPESTSNQPRPANRKQKSTKIAIKLAVAAIVFTVSLMIVDRLMGLFLPAQAPVQVAHPANFSELRKNLEFTVTFETNRLGLRSPEIPLRREDDSEFRIAFAGDSYTEGHGVELDASYPMVIERLARTSSQPVRCINDGFSGSGPMRYCRGLLCVGLQYRPDLAVLAIHTNDLDDTTLEDQLRLQKTSTGYRVAPTDLKWQPGSPTRRLAYRLLPWTYSRLQSLKSKNTQTSLESMTVLEQIRTRALQLGIATETINERISRIPAEIVEACDNGLFNRTLVARACLTPDHHQQSLDILSESANAKWSKMSEILDQTVGYCRREDVNVAIVYVPTPFQYDPDCGQVERAIGVVVDPKWLEEESELERRLRSWSTQRDLPYLSLTDTFRTAIGQHAACYNYPLDTHWNEAGQALAGETIYQWLNDNESLPVTSEP